MQQSALFHEDIYDALSTDIAVLGGPKKVATMLWPAKSARAAADHLANCLSRHRAEKLDIEQIMFLIRKAKEQGSYCTLSFLADDTGFTRPMPVEPEDEKAALQRQFIQQVEQQRLLIERMERLNAVPTTKGRR